MPLYWLGITVLYNRFFIFQVVVNSPTEVEEIFDAVSYEKGASIIRMLSNYLGFEVRFSKGG